MPLGLRRERVFESRFATSSAHHVHFRPQFDQPRQGQIKRVVVDVHQYEILLRLQLQVLFQLMSFVQVMCGYRALLQSERNQKSNRDRAQVNSEALP
jgi:hypothetical protein